MPTAVETFPPPYPRDAEVVLGIKCSTSESEPETPNFANIAYTTTSQSPLGLLTATMKIKCQELQNCVRDGTRWRYPTGGRPYINKVVVTVPVRFNPYQRFSLKFDLKRIGLRIDELLIEPIAAAVKFTRTEIPRNEKDRTVLIVDFGYKDCSASIVRFQEGAPSLREFRCERFTKDVDEILLDWTIDEFRSQYKLEIPESCRQDLKDSIEGNKTALDENVDECVFSRLYQEFEDSIESVNRYVTGRATFCEKSPEPHVVFFWGPEERLNNCYFDLCDSPTRTIDLERTMFEDLIKPLTNRYRELVESAVRRVGSKNIHCAMITHSAVHPPQIVAVRKMLEDIFGKQKVKYLGGPQEVAEGAAIYANSLRTGKIQKCKNLPLGEESMGSLPCSLGIRLSSISTTDTFEDFYSFVPVTSSPKFQFKIDSQLIDFYESAGDNLERSRGLRELFVDDLLKEEKAEPLFTLLNHDLINEPSEMKRESCLLTQSFCHEPATCCHESYMHCVYHIDDGYGNWLLKRGLSLRIVEVTRINYSLLRQSLDIDWEELTEYFSCIKEDEPNCVIERCLATDPWRQDIKQFGNKWLTFRERFSQWLELRNQLQTILSSLQQHKWVHKTLGLRDKKKRFKFLLDDKSTISQLRDACSDLESHFQDASRERTNALTNLESKIQDLEASCPKLWRQERRWLHNHPMETAEMYEMKLEEIEKREYRYERRDIVRASLEQFFADFSTGFLLDDQNKYLLSQCRDFSLDMLRNEIERNKDWFRKHPNARPQEIGRVHKKLHQRLQEAEFKARDWLELRHSLEGALFAVEAWERTSSKISDYENRVSKARELLSGDSSIVQLQTAYFDTRLQLSMYPEALSAVQIYSSLNSEQLRHANPVPGYPSSAAQGIEARKTTAGSD
eukprot:Gregarina_sp_Poly_1__1804@NODE_1469_length_4060_cov_150_374405_g973_i0_p1_GENE_NODE_1469_length_4060_cov_150_374405_g973_i0NODE_1469_length_4060_cov_150_374405_g973_i0_p1_ORF_typecomplete_len903_score121_15HSP70/PF00012_20/4_2e18HSP70/PF00012_20/2_1e05HSP70/PF00012_20/8_3e02MreB_Mbl/PF06723_13/1_7e05MreB_Mbl/PF06723_13/1_1e03APG17/PF04108_12/1_9e03APG17/PF04108_12/0_0015APG17/PF04108_12/1_5e03DUF1572/PF07609_11/0_93DUF1572/PF07609_11/11PilM_2/PF11104_8/0_011CEP63/PF17045_5/2_6e03CEP63/PF17045_5/